jgi:hypothetical protein
LNHLTSVCDEAIEFVITSMGDAMYELEGVSAIQPDVSILSVFRDTPLVEC